MTPETSGRASWRRFGPLLALLVLMMLVLLMGWHKHLSLETIGRNYDKLQAIVRAQLWLSIAAYTTLYAVVTALSLPLGTVMTIGGGLLFGWELGAPAAAVGATAGASVVFLVARSSLGESLANRVGPALARLRDGFARNAFSYLLFLRLVPAFPFVIVNLAPAMLGVGLLTFVTATLIGILPATYAYSVAGAGLASVVRAENAAYADCLSKAGSGVPCTYSIAASELVTKELVLAFAALSLVALIPVAIRFWSKRHAAA